MTANYKFGAASNFIINFQELQNTITNAGGTSPFATLSNTVSQLQQMVLFDEKRIAVNTISAFDTTPIQVVDSLNFSSNATLTLNGTAVQTGSTTYGAVTSIGNVSSFTYYTNTVSTLATAITFQTGAPAQQPFRVLGGGNIQFPAAGTPGVGKVLTCMDLSGTAEWQTPAMPSDGRWKTDIREIGGAEAIGILERVRGARFCWNDTGAQDVGLIAQDLLPVLPEAVVEGRNGLLVQYHKLIPVLVEAVTSLQARVAELEAAAAARLV
jgi:hypothetical protein